MKSTKFLFLLFIPFIFLSCFEDDDDNGAYASEINDFIWKGMNAAYLYKADIIDLSNDRFNDSEEYASYLNSYPSNIRSSALHTHHKSLHVDCSIGMCGNNRDCLRCWKFLMG